MTNLDEAEPRHSRTQLVMGRVDVGVAWLVVAGFGVLAVRGMLVVTSDSFRDWYMHLAMYAVILVLILLYLKSHYLRRTFRALINLLVAAGMLWFWSGIASDLVPARRVWFEGEVISRPQVQGMEFVSGGAMALAIGLALHFVTAQSVRWALDWRRKRAAEPASVAAQSAGSGSGST